MRARAYCAHPSIRDHWVLRCMSRCPDQVVSLKDELNMFLQNVEEWSETNITGNNSFQWYLLTWSQVKWADIENYVEFLSKEMPDIKIDDNCLFEVERRLNLYLNSNKLEQLENKHAKILIKFG
ncbi:hypothetical protein TNCV_281101 [Trichonephila clavipes]|nr:hypothetical protein TNCV_281101 [Trichonephila clavipes]